AVTIVLVGFILGKIISRLIEKLTDTLKIDSFFEKVGIKISISGAIGQLFAYFIYFVSIILAFDRLGLASTMIYFLATAALVIIVFSTILAIKDFVPNFFAGIKIYRKRMYDVGDIIKVKNIIGIVTKITLTETQMKTKSGDILYIPNSALLSSSFSVKKKKN
ncbi:MAG: mechanosensitive ion channel, partial [Candidatus Woesearchaeota archaeon]